MSQCRFTLQFLVNCHHIMYRPVERTKMFQNDDYNLEDDMKIPLQSLDVKDHRLTILSNFCRPILHKLLILQSKVKNDPNIKSFVSKALQKLIDNVYTINSIELCRMLLLIKVGIPANCKKDTLNALIELQVVIDTYFPPDRVFFNESDKQKFSQNIVSMAMVGEEACNKLLDNLDLSKNMLDKIQEILNTVKNDNYPTLIVNYLENAGRLENNISIVDGTFKLIQIINERSKKHIEFSQISISCRLMDDELHVDYYGFLDKYIAGTFSVDFNRLKNIIKAPPPFYIFYLVTCAYCSLHTDNVLKIHFDVTDVTVKNMFIFFNTLYYSKIKKAIELIPDHMCYAKVFKHLQKFIEHN